MLTSTTREEILLALKGSFSHFDNVLQKWIELPAVAKFQILQTDTDFMLRISSYSQAQSDPVVFTSTRNVASVTPHSSDESSLQIQLRGAPPHDVKFRLRFHSSQDKDHFFLILRNAVEELKSRGLSREPEAATYPATMSPVVLRGAESQPRRSEVESLIEDLQKNVAGGDCSGASEAAMSLAKKKAKLSISADEIGDVPGMRSKFNLEICVEDRHSSGAKIKLTDVNPNMTIGFLKKLVFQLYQFPVEVQHWIIGRRIVRDAETLMESRINSSTPVFLYLISSEKAGITREEVELGRQALRAQQMQHFFQPMPWSDAASVPAREVPKVNQNPGPKPPNRGSRDNSLPATPPVPAAPKKPTAEEVGWHCPTCTLINPPLVPGCRACLMDRPEDYVIPPIDSYIMDKEEKAQHEELHRNDQLMEERLVTREELDQTLLGAQDDQPGLDLTLNYLSD